MRRTLKCLAVVCISLMSLSLSVAAQTPGPGCPTITIDCPTNLLQPGDQFTVTAALSGADPKLTLSYHWSISAGKILSGQGTPSISVGELPKGETFTATVEVGGLDSICQKSASCTMTNHFAPQSRRFDKFGDLAFADEKKRLDYFAEQLAKEPVSQGHLIVYGRRGARAGEAEARAVRAKQYLVTKRGIEAERLVTIDGGLRARLWIELWITPQGGQAPMPVDEDGEPLGSN